MNKKILLVDDSPFMRKIMSDLISEIDGLSISSTARNGRDALKQLGGSQPDVVLMDVQMPGLNGLDTLAMIREAYQLPVMMMSADSSKDLTIEALERGAIDFIEKPKDLSRYADDFKAVVAEKMRVLDRTTVPSQIKPLVSMKKESAETVDFQQTEAIVIGASTGGPKALLTLIRNLPAKVTLPIFIVQHMPAGFTASFAERLNKETSATVVEATDGMPIQSGTIYIAPGDHHMEIHQNKICLHEEAKIHGVRPAVDLLFQSAATCYGAHLVGLILTGMGHDGTKGCSSIKQHGGFILAQDEETSVVYGMPGNAVKQGMVDQSASLTKLSEWINWIIG